MLDIEKLGLTDEQKESLIYHLVVAFIKNQVDNDKFNRVLNTTFDPISLEMRNRIMDALCTHKKTDNIIDNTGTMSQSEINLT